VTVEQNRALVRRYVAESVNGVNGPNRERSLAVLDELLTDDFAMAYNNDAAADVMRGRDRHRQFLADHARHYPDDEWQIEDLVADDATVACQWRIRATHAGSGRRIDVRAADIFKVRDGRLAELRRFLDFADLDAQTRAPASD
jgi:steroid delta-isomerase-like uncharacterized protein